MTITGVILRAAQPSDLTAINQVITAAIMTWRLPERVKRLTIPSYCYRATDFQHMRIMVAQTAQGQLAGVAAWEDAAIKDLPPGRNALLLHGLYVAPEYQHQGIGSRLLRCAQTAAGRAQRDGLLVKAQADACGFFQARGLVKLPVSDPLREYEHRYWLDATTG
jgi:GNAT superfamily N-acetyltransferase